MKTVIDISIHLIFPFLDSILEYINVCCTRRCWDMPVKCQNISFQTFIFPDIGFPMFETTLNWSNFINYCFGENCNMPWCYEKYQRMLKVALNCENILQLLAHIMIVLVRNRYRETSVTIRRRIFLSFPRTWNTEKRISIRITGGNKLKQVAPKCL